MEAIQPPLNKLVESVAPRVVAREVEVEDTGESYELNFNRGGRITRQTAARLERQGKKYCSHCERVLPIDEFRELPDGPDKWCLECKREYGREYHYRQYHEGGLKEEMADGRAHLSQLYTGLLGGVCNRCGHDEPIDLEFHHVIPEEKEYSLGDLFNPRRRMEWERLVEANKCALLCDRCHRRLEIGWWDGVWAKVDYGYRLIDWFQCE